MPKIVVPLSGGADSVAILVLAAQTKLQVYPVFIDYGQQSRKHELKAAKKAVEWAQMHWPKVKPLVRMKLPLSNVAPCRVMGEDPPTKADSNYVPARNTFLALAATEYALELGATEIWFGFTKPYDNIEPLKDQTRSFLRAFSRFVPMAFEEDCNISFKAPLITWNKTKVLSYLHDAEYPLERLWTCYTTAKKPCGKCGSCMSLNRAANENSFDWLDFLA